MKAMREIRYEFLKKVEVEGNLYSFKELSRMTGISVDSIRCKYNWQVKNKKTITMDGLMPFRKSTFWSKVEVKDSGFHEWTGARRTNGYGVHSVGGMKQAHRWVWEYVYGAVPAGKLIMHSCDNRLCVNIEHLSLGTPAENSKDMAEKKRSTYGERNRHAKLTAEKVVAIRSLKGSLPAREAAKRYKCCVQTIRLIWRRKTWRHAEESIGHEHE